MLDSLQYLHFAQDLLFGLWYVPEFPLLDDLNGNPLASFSMQSLFYNTEVASVNRISCTRSEKKKDLRSQHLIYMIITTKDLHYKREKMKVQEPETNLFISRLVAALEVKEDERMIS